MGQVKNLIASTYIMRNTYQQDQWLPLEDLSTVFKLVIQGIREHLDSGWNIWEVHGEILHRINAVHLKPNCRKRTANATFRSQITRGQHRGRALDDAGVDYRTVLKAFQVKNNLQPIVNGNIFIFKTVRWKKITQNIISSCYIIFLKTHAYNKIGISDKLKMSFNYLIVNGSFHLRVCAKIAITVVCISIIHAINIYLNFSHEKSGNKQDYQIFKKIM